MAKQEKNSTPAEPPLPAFEKSLEELEQIVHAIEAGQVTLEQSLLQYERGMKLIKHCRGILETAETKIKQLTVDDKGQLVEKPGP